jgi:hypothetical protein
MTDADDTSAERVVEAPNARWLRDCDVRILVCRTVV